MRVMHWREKADVFCGFTLLPSDIVMVQAYDSLWCFVVCFCNSILYIFYVRFQPIVWVKPYVIDEPYDKLITSHPIT